MPLRPLMRRFTMERSFSLGLLLLGLAAGLTFLSNGWALFRIASTRLEPNLFSTPVIALKFVLSALAISVVALVYVHFRRHLFAPIASFHDEQVRLLRTAVEAASDAVVILEGDLPSDEPSRIVYVNRGFETMTGYRREEVFGQPAHVLVSPGEVSVLKTRLTRHLENQPKDTRAYEFRRKDGRPLWVELSLVRLGDGDGRAHHWLAIGRDVTERRNTQAMLEATNRQLARERAYLQNINDHIPVGLASLDPALRFRWVNATYAAIRGKPVTWYEGRHLFEVFPEAAAALEAPIRGIAAQGGIHKVKAFTTLREHRPGMRHWDITCSALSGPEGIESVLILCEDVTERVEKARMQDEQIEKLKEVDRLKDYMLSTVSHELKTPLSMIRGYAELLEEHCTERELLAGILDGSRRLDEHLNDLLDYSALISASLPLYMTEVNPAEVVTSAVAVLGEALAAKHQEPEVALAPHLPWLIGDARRIQQMLMELLHNAHKVTPPGGSLGIAARREGGQVAFEVWDTGSGIEPAQTANIWEPFGQIESDDASRRGGLGLGLPIVKKLAEMHHGSVTVEPRPGGGSRFTLRLPLPTPD